MKTQISPKRGSKEKKHRSP
ncbi:unnamed protein product [Spirodela intermedia]|uniref:Uncharacterized protein n=1 Tax=Spirodela intermedia TaxID=51605 RepID=A0A7I8JEY2_SPIIN|nr:unnamed protein product [Spirodela intermedia]CAA6668728.1 unnamed protein product [Spirodela intermedia]